MTLAPADIPRITEIRVDGLVLGVAMVLAMVTGLAFGIVPAIQARRADLQGALKSDDSRGATAGRERSVLRSTLVVSEVALAVVLLVGAGPAREERVATLAGRHRLSCRQRREGGVPVAGESLPGGWRAVAELRRGAPIQR